MILENILKQKALHNLSSNLWECLVKRSESEEKEFWKYTSLKKLNKTSYSIPESVESPYLNSQFETLAKKYSTQNIFILQNNSLFFLHPDENLDIDIQGVKAEVSPELSSLELINQVFIEGSISISVKSGVILDQPIVLIFAATSEEESFLVNRHVHIVLGNQSQAHLVQVTVSDRSHFLNDSLSIELGDEASLRHDACVDTDARTKSLVTAQTSLGKKAEYIKAFACLSGGVVKEEQVIFLQGQEARAQVFGLITTDEDQSVDLNYQIKHQASCTKSDQLVKGIASGKSRLTYKAEAFVESQALDSEAHQKINHLQLSTKSEANALPRLEIHTDQVQCSHGATIGQLDKEGLFYLRSRGVSEEEARQLLLKGFSQELIEHFSSEILKEEVKERLQSS